MFNLWADDCMHTFFPSTGLKIISGLKIYASNWKNIPNDEAEKRPITLQNVHQSARVCVCVSAIADDSAEGKKPQWEVTWSLTAALTSLS